MTPTFPSTAGVITMARPGRSRQPSHRPNAPNRVRAQRPPRFHIVWAYSQLEQPCDPAERTAFDWALAKAREFDRGHEHEYPEGNDFESRDMLLQLAGENVRDLMRAFRKTHA